METRKFLGVFFLLLFVAWICARIALSITFDRDVANYLKQAAMADTIEVATESLSLAIENFEIRSAVRDGYTSLIVRTPNEDVRAWYFKLKTCLQELEAMRKGASQMEKKNMLLRVRSDLVVYYQVIGPSPIVPSGIAVFPHNKLFAHWGWWSLVLTCVFGLWWRVDVDRLSAK